MQISSHIAVKTTVQINVRTTSGNPKLCHRSVGILELEEASFKRPYMNAKSVRKAHKHISVQFSVQ
jgi:hypothetical protein